MNRRNQAVSKIETVTGIDGNYRPIPKAGKVERGRQKIGNAIANHPVAAGAVALAAAGISFAAGNHAPTIEHAPVQSAAYLNQDKTENVEVSTGDTGESIAQQIYQENWRGNGPAELSGQALIDAGNYIDQQGSPIAGPNRTVAGYDLAPGQVVKVPEVTPAQAEQHGVH